MSTSAFNPDLFMQTENKEANSTVLVPVPEKEYVGVIKDAKVRVAKESVILDVTWSIDDEEAAKVTGIKEPTVRQSLFLDITESGGLDMGKGKNVQLGRLREALKQNTSGKAWAPNMLIGQPARIKVTHTANKEDSSIVYANVGAVTAL